MNALKHDIESLRRMVNAEAKFVKAIDNTAHTPSTTPSRIFLHPLSRGTDALDRIGRTIKLDRVSIRATYTQNAAATNTTLRLVLLWDKTPGGATPTYADVFDHASSPVAHTNLANVKRFVIMKDHLICMKSGTLTAFGEFQLEMGLNHHSTCNSGNAGDITDVETGALFLFMISTEATNTPSVYLDTRVRFYDN